MLRLPLLVAVVLVATACSDRSDLPSATAAPAEARAQDSVAVVRGGRLFAQYCASCHGAGAEGAPDWRRRDPQGYFPPPPLNGSGHAWHHPRAMLHSIIANGSPGGGRMPAWGGQLRDEEIAAIIDWFQSLWPDEIHAAWRDIDRRARHAAR